MTDGEDKERDKPDMTTLQWAHSPTTTRPIDITSSAWKRDPFTEYARLRVEQPVCKVKFGRLDAWLVTRYDDVLAVLKDERFVKNRRQVQSAEQVSKQGWMPAFLRPLERNMLDLDDPDHARLRGLVHKAFTPQRIEQMQTRIEAIAKQLIDEMQAKRCSGSGARLCLAAATDGDCGVAGHSP